LINAEIGPARERYNDLLANSAQIEEILRHGADKARRVSQLILAEVCDRVGIRNLARQ